MRSAKSLIPLAGLALSSALLVSAPPGRPAAADDSTPVPTIVTPQVTVIVSTPEVPTVAPPIIHRERTPVPVSTQPAPTAPVAPVVAIPTSAAAIVPTPAAPTIDPSTYDPSPAELRLNARLRWGDRVPRAVRRWAFLVVPAAR